MTDHLRRILVVALLLLLSCNTEPCACPPAASALVVYGKVLAKDGAPIAGATVRVELADLNCVFPAAPFASTATDLAGSYRTAPTLGLVGFPFCLRVVAASLTPGDPPLAIVSGILGRFDERPDAIDSVGVVLREE